MASAVPRRRLQLQQHLHTPSGVGLQMSGEVPAAGCCCSVDSTVSTSV